MDDDVDLLVGNAEQVVGLDQLEALFISVAESIVILPPISHVGA